MGPSMVGLPYIATIVEQVAFEGLTEVDRLLSRGMLVAALCHLLFSCTELPRRPAQGKHAIVPSRECCLMMLIGRLVCKLSLAAR